MRRSQELHIDGSKRGMVVENTRLNQCFDCNAEGRIVGKGDSIIRLYDI